jgi:NagD protein
MGKMAKNLKDIKCFVLDMDGTFYLENTIIDGSLDFIDNLKKANKEFLFLTNNSSHNSEFYIKRLKNMGLNITDKQIITSGYATAKYAKKEYKNKKAYLLGNEFLKDELQKNGVKIDNSNPDYIIVGFDTTLTYKKMCEVCFYARKGYDIIATHPDFNCPTATGEIPDIGAILAFIKASTGVKPKVVIGKPNKYIFDLLINERNIKKQNIAIVGDRLYTDIKSAKVNNITSILVMTGETDKKMLKESKIKPDFIFERLKDIPVM